MTFANKLRAPTFDGSLQAGAFFVKECGAVVVLSPHLCFQSSGLFVLTLCPPAGLA